MKQLKGSLLVILPLTLTALLWLIQPRIYSMDLMGIAFYIIGAVSITAFALTFFLSIRSKRIESWFNGLDTLYVVHKWLAISSLLLVFLHAFLKQIYSGGYETLGGKIGSISEYLFVILIVIALVGKRLNYENWRIFHRLLLIPFVIGVYHMFLSSPVNLLSFSTISLWMGAVVVVGVASSFYMLVLYRTVAFKHKGKITGIKYLGNSVLELEMTLNKPMKMVEGQYAFLRIFQKGIESAPHPFSISGKSENKLYITIKALGDYTTQLVKEVQCGSLVSLDGPFGHMDFNAGKAKQVWVAGGVGITPFISYLRSTEPNVKVNLYYSYRGEKEGMYKEFLKQAQSSNPNLTIKFVDTTISGRINIDEIIADEETTVYMCGPQKMIESYALGLKQKYKHTEIIFEAFKFAR